MSKSKTDRPLSSWDAKLQRRHEFCERFVREHHPGMANAHKIKGARPLVPLDGPRRIDIGDPDWWLQTNESMSELGFTYLAYLFGRHGLLDHEWMIGRDEHEPWALISESYASQTLVEGLRQDLEKVGTELLEYPFSQSTHNPTKGTLMLVANVTNIHALMGAVARLIVAQCPPVCVDADEATS
jgi:hypothetical protein